MHVPDAFSRTTENNTSNANSRGYTLPPQNCGEETELHWIDGKKSSW
jgi:hypothetical protein